MSSWVSRVCVACLLMGCGAKQEAKAPAPKPAAPPVAEVVEDAPDLSPVKKPAEVAVIGRIARPRLFAETLTKWSSLPLRVEDMLPPEARSFSNVVLWEAPIEMVVALDAFGEGKLPTPLVVGSVGLKSLAEGLRTAESMQLPTRKLAPGVYRVGDYPDVSCAIAVSLGAAPARLVCGPGNKDVDTLLPYTTRGLPNEPRTGADFELTLDPQPIQNKYSRDVAALRVFAGMAMREISLDTPRFDRALSDILYGLVDETSNLFADLEQVRLEARLDAARSVLTGALELKLKGQSSWLAGTLAASQPIALPATLPRLPPGTTVGAYAAPLPSERYAGFGRILGDLAEGYLEHEKLPEPTRKRAHRVLEGLFAKHPENFGFIVSPSQNDSIGYLHSDTMVTRFSEPAARYLGLYDDMLGLLNDPAIRRRVTQRLPLMKAWPKVSKKPLRLPGFKAPATLYEATFDLKALSELDASFAKALENMLPPADGKQLSHYALAVQPDGAYTYVISGDDTKEMGRVLVEHKKSEPGVFFARPARSDKVLSAGFVTLTYLARYLARTAKQPEIIKAVNATPHHGESPLSFSSTVGPSSTRIDVEIPAAVLGDATTAAVQVGPALKDAFKNR